MSFAIEQLPFDFSSRPAFGREDFFIGDSNIDAVMWVDRWPDWPAAVLIISGPAASGKSHLSAVWTKKTGASVVYAEQFHTRQAKDIASMGEHLVVDGIDPWLGCRESETTLFHLYNMFREEKRSLLLNMRMTPVSAEFALPDLASRLRAAPLALIQPPDDALLGAVLIKLFNDRQLNVSPDVIGYLLPRMERSFAAARDIVSKADQLALSRQKSVSVSLMRDILSHMQGMSQLALF